MQSKKILVIDNYDSFTYNLVHYIEELNYKVDVFRNDQISLDAINHYEKIVLSPGPGLPKDAGIMKELIKKYAPTKKILGVCLGMQAIGEVFGASLQNLEQVYHGIASSITVTDKNDVLYKSLPKTFDVGRYHSWVIDKNTLPQVLKITSIEKNGQIMSISHKKFNVYGVQYHPESILTKNGKKIMENFLKV